MKRIYLMCIYSDMGNARNIKLGGGALKLGRSIINNTMPTFQTGIPTTLRDIESRPLYYVDKLSKAQGMGVDDVDFTQTNLFNIESPTQHKDPHKFAPTLDALKIAKDKVKTDKDGNQVFGLQPPATLTFNTTLSTERFEDISNSYYRIGYEHPTEGTKTTRKLRYFHTCEEVQIAIDEDLISGDNGYKVSTGGMIKRPDFGPYLLQSNSFGNKSSEKFYITDQSDPSLISGELIGYDGSEDNRAMYTIRHHIPEDYSFSGTFLLVNMDRKVDHHGDPLHTYDILFNLYDENITAGSYSNLHNKSLILAENLDFRSGFIRDSELDQNAGLINHDLGSKFLTGVGLNAGPNTISFINGATVRDYHKNLQFLFSGEVDFNHMDRDVTLTGITKITESNDRHLDMFMPTPDSFYYSINSDSLGYTEDEYWEYGAPHLFHGTKYGNLTGIKITNSDLKYFRIPESFKGSCHNVAELDLNNNPNLEYFIFRRAHFPHLKKLDISNCSIDIWNNHHPFTIKNEYGNLAFTQTAEAGQYNMARYITVERPDEALTSMYDADLLEDFDGFDTLVGRDDAFSHLDKETKSRNLSFTNIFPTKSLRHINVAGNKLNITGISLVVESALAISAHNGYLNISNQNWQGTGPEAPLFSSNGNRGNMYTLQNNGEPVILSTHLLDDDSGDFDSELYDVHDETLFAINRLINEKGWEVIYDTY